MIQLKATPIIRPNTPILSFPSSFYGLTVKTLLDNRVFIVDTFI
jgi:hypothetical protein